jgi:virulence-associated protein VapD
MAEKISVQIALSGGREIQRQLEDIGTAGQKAFADISKSAEQVGFKNIKPEQVTAALNKFGVEGSAAINKVTEAVRGAARLETIVQGVQGVESAIVGLGRAALVVGPAIAAAFVAASKATIAFAETINKTSDQAVKLGLSFEQFTQQRKGLEAFGLSTEAAAEGLAHMAQASEQVKLDQVAQAFKDVQAAAKLGQVSQEIFTLTNAARGVGPAADAARKALVEMGAPIPTNIPQTLAQLTQQLGSSKAGMDAFIAQLRQMPDGLARETLAINSLGQAAGTQLVQGIRAAEGSMTSAEQKAFELGQAIQRLQQAWANLGSVALASLITPQLNQIASALEAVQNAINNFTWTNFGQAGVEAAMALTNALNPIPGFIQKIIQALAGLDWSKLRGPGITGGEAGAVPGIAGGGVIGGRGTGTSDSNLAWVSRGEHIMPARAVAQPGVLAFLEALRRSGGNLSHVLDGMGRFALGGLVPRPAFAGGGAVGSMSHVTIQFPGLQPIGGLRASAEVVDQLQKAAALAQIRSGGRKPSRYS